MTTSIESLIRDLLAFLEANPGSDIEDFAHDQGCSVADISEGWHNHFNEVESNRSYNIESNQGSPASYHPAQPPRGDDDDDHKHYLNQEINNYHEYVTNNHIEDNSFNQTNFVGGDLSQEIDIDNSDNTADDGGVLIRDSEVDDSNINTGDRAVVDSERANTGDVKTSADDGGQAQTGLHFGDGDLKQANQANEVNATSGDATGGKGGDGTGGDADSGDGGHGGDADADAYADDAGQGGDGGSGFLVGGDGGDGGDNDADADATGGHGGHSGNAAGGDGSGGAGGGAASGNVNAHGGDITM